MESQDDNNILGSSGRIDEAMLEWSEFVSQMTEVDGYLVDYEMGTAMQLEHVEMSMPVQLDLSINDDGSVVIGGSPPIYYVETTFAPVFHQLNIKIGVTINQNEDAGSTEQRLEP